MLALGALGEDTDLSSAAVSDAHGRLSNVLGNLLSRTLAPRVMPAGGALRQAGAGVAEDKVRTLPGGDALVDACAAAAEKAGRCYDDAQLRPACAAALEPVRAANALFALAKPWEGGADAEPALLACLEAMRVSFTLLQPVMPDACTVALDALGVGEQDRTAAAAGGPWRAERPLAMGAQGALPQPLFPRVGKGIVETLLASVAH